MTAVFLMQTTMSVLTTMEAANKFVVISFLVMSVGVMMGTNYVMMDEHAWV